MTFFGRDYDRDYGYRPARGPWGNDRSQWGPTGAYPNETRWGAGDRGYGWAGTNRYGAEFDRGYDRGYKSRWQTDYGDPFGDRQKHTPIRVFNEEPHGIRGWESTYDRDYNSSPYPMGYRTWNQRHGYDNGYYGRGYRGYPRQDTRWF